MSGAGSAPPSGDPDATARFVAGLPKAELHLHFDGALLPDDRRFFAERNGLDLPEVAFRRWNPTVEPGLSGEETAAANLASFLEVLEASRVVLLTRDDFQDAMVRVIEHCSKSGTVYAEIFFDPQAHTSRGIAFETVVEGLAAGVTEGFARFGVHVQLIMCFHRYRPASDALELLELARPYRDRIVGIGLDDHEGGDWVSRFVDVYAEAARQGYRLTAHCDVDQPLAVENMWRCLDELHVERIDHGLNVLDDPQLLRRMVDEGIACTACPTWYSAQAGPQRVGRILEMKSAGILVSINSDDPGLFASGGLDTIFTSFAGANAATADDLVGLAENSFRSAWITPDERDRFLTALTNYSSLSA